VLRTVDEKQVELLCGCRPSPTKKQGPGGGDLYKSEGLATEACGIEVATTANCVVLGSNSDGRLFVVDNGREELEDDSLNVPIASHYIPPSSACLWVW
jgi:hypothetical protein